MKTELAILWGIVCLLCIVIEMTTGTFFLLCVSVGALGALVVALLGGGAVFYFKVLRPKQQKAAAPQEDYGDELTDYDEPDGYGDEDEDGPPWDEEDDDGEEADK